MITRTTSKILLLILSINTLYGSQSVTFEIGTFNILNEEFYASFYKKGSPGKMSVKQRSQLTQNFFNQLLNNNTDPLIVAFQEFDDNRLDLLNVYNALAVASSPQDQGLKTIYQLPWNIVSSKYIKFGSPKVVGKGMRILTFQPIATDGSSLGRVALINVHLEGQSGRNFITNKQQAYRLVTDQVQRISDYIAQHKNNITYWIVCGDFNFDSRKYPDLYWQVIKILNSSGKEFADILDPNDPLTSPTARASSTAYDNLLNIDYMFYTPNNGHLIVDKVTINGEDPGPDVFDNLAATLLTHGNASGTPDNQRDGISDHAAIFATFTLKEPKPTIKAPPAAKPIPIPGSKLDQQMKKKAAEDKKKKAALPIKPIKIIKPKPKPIKKPIPKKKPSPIKVSKKVTAAQKKQQAALAKKMAAAQKKQAVNWAHLEKAIKNNNLSAVKKLAKNFRKNSKNAKGQTAVGLALKYKKVAIAKYLNTQLK